MQEEDLTLGCPLNIKLHREHTLGRTYSESVKTMDTLNRTLTYADPVAKQRPRFRGHPIHSARFAWTFSLHQSA